VLDPVNEAVRTDDVQRQGPIETDAQEPVEPGEMIHVGMGYESMARAQELAWRQRREIAEIEQQRATPEAEIDEQSRIGERFVDEAGLNEPCHARLSHAYLRLRPLEHRQFPVGARFVEFQDVQRPVVAPDFDVAVVRPVPLIERFGDFEPTAIEVKRPEHRHATVIRMELDLNAHGLHPNDASYRPCLPRTCVT